MENFSNPVTVAISIILLAHLVRIIRKVNWHKETEDLRDVFKAVLSHFHSKAV